MIRELGIVGNSVGIVRYISVVAHFQTFLSTIREGAQSVVSKNRDTKYKFAYRTRKAKIGCVSSNL